MEVLERPTFESDDSKRIYQYVERQGRADTDVLRETFDLSEEELQTQVDRLASKGYLRAEDGAVALELEIGTEQTFETKDVTYVVRPARNEDFEQLVSTIQAVTDRRTYAVGEELAMELRYEDTVTRHNNVWSRVFFVATVDDYVVGWSHLDLPQVDKLRNTAQLTVGTRSEFRGYGIGKQLLDRALAWAEANDYEKVYNSVAETNMNAVTFLEAQGWEREATRENHFTIGDQQVDEIMLAYTFYSNN